MTEEENMDVYRTTVEVHAKQFTGDHVAIEDWAADLVNRGIGQRLADRWSGGSIFWGDYRGITVTPLDAPVLVIAGRGDWIVCHPVEGWRVYTPAEFDAAYEPARVAV